MIAQVSDYLGIDPEWTYVEEFNNFEKLLYEIEVMDVVQGADVSRGDEIRIRQNGLASAVRLDQCGGGGWIPTDDPPLVPGLSYLLILERQPDGVLVGDAPERFYIESDVLHMIDPFPSIGGIALLNGTSVDEARTILLENEREIVHYD